MKIFLDNNKGAKIAFQLLNADTVVNTKSQFSLLYFITSSATGYSYLHKDQSKIQ